MIVFAMHPVHCSWVFMCRFYFFLCVCFRSGDGALEGFGLCYGSNGVEPLFFCEYTGNTMVRSNGITLHDTNGASNCAGSYSGPCVPPSTLFTAHDEAAEVCSGHWFEGTLNIMFLFSILHRKQHSYVLFAWLPLMYNVWTRYRVRMFKLATGCVCYFVSAPSFPIVLPPHIIIRI